MKIDLEKIKENYVNKTTSILGTIYTIVFADKEKEEEMKGEAIGLCDFSNKTIYLSKEGFDTNFTDPEELIKQTIRHEIFHAFLYESGLDSCSNNTENWATNEEMVDWFSIQSPKIFEACNELNAI